MCGPRNFPSASYYYSKNIFTVDQMAAPYHGYQIAPAELEAAEVPDVEHLSTRVPKNRVFQWSACFFCLVGLILVWCHHHAVAPERILSMHAPQFMNNSTCDHALQNASSLLFRTYLDNSTNHGFLKFRAITFAHLKSTNCSALADHGRKGTLDAFISSWYKNDGCMSDMYQFIRSNTYWTTGLVGATLFVALAAFIMSFFGFGATGVVSNSAAAAWQSSIGNVAAGSIFAQLQSIAMTGLLTKILLALVVVDILPFMFDLLFIDKYGSCQNNALHLATPLNLTADYYMMTHFHANTSFLVRMMKH